MLLYCPFLIKHNIDYSPIINAHFLLDLISSVNNK